MKSSIYLLFVAVPALLCLQAQGVEPPFKLSGPKSLVLPVETREIALEVARQYFSDKPDLFIEEAEGVESPYAFEQAVETAPVAETPEEEEEVAVSYDEASVLRVVALNFAKQVGGALSRGSTSYLQLQGGSLVKPGASFPVTIPQAKGQVFTVTVSEITPDSYTLQLGDATQEMTIDGKAPGDSGAIRID